MGWTCPGTPPTPRNGKSPALRNGDHADRVPYALLQSRRAEAMVKVVALTELHLLTAYPEGRAFVDWLARVGRN